MLVYNKSFMLHIFDEFLVELPEFNAFMEYELKNKMLQYNNIPIATYLVQTL